MSTYLLGFALFLSIPAPAKIVHLGILGEDAVTITQFDRMNERLHAINPDARVVDLRRDRGFKTFADRPRELRELGSELGATLNGLSAPIELVVVQATADDFADVWAQVDRGETPLAGLRGHLGVDAQIVLTGAPVGATAARAKALLDALGAPAGSLVTATSDVHVHRPTGRLALHAIATTVTLLLFAPSVALIQTIPRDETWVEWVWTGGAILWTAAEFGVGRVVHRARGIHQPYRGEEFFRIEPYLRGIAAFGFVIGQMYFGRDFIGHVPPVTTLAVGLLTAGVYGYSRRRALASYIAPNVFNLNRARAFAFDPEVREAAVSAEDQRLYSCAARLEL